MFWMVFLSGVVGARIWDWFFYENFSALPWWEIFNIRGGGLAIHGFILGALLGLILLRLLNSKFQIPNSIRFLAPVLLLGQGIGRWGNFFNQELYGLPTNLPWGIFISSEKRLPGFETFQFFQPVFLYESLWLFLGLIIFLRLEKWTLLYVPNSKFQILNSFFIFWIFCGRALMELIRLDPAPLWFGLRAPLVYSAIIALVAFIALFSRPRL